MQSGRALGDTHCISSVASDVYKVQMKAGSPETVPAEVLPLTVELDVFEGRYQGLILAEVEFPTMEQAESFTPPSWFGPDVTLSGEYQNSRLSRG